MSRRLTQWEVQTPYGQGRIALGRYLTGARSIVLIKEDGQPMASLTVNLPEAQYQLRDDEVFVKAWSENEPLLQPLLSTGLFEDTGVREPAGFVQAPVWRLRGELAELHRRTP